MCRPRFGRAVDAGPAINVGLLIGRSSRRRLQACVGSSRLAIERLGSPYGGWVVPTVLLEEPATAICAGAGEDISFDIELLRRGMSVVTLDPTPRAVSHVKGVMAAEGSDPGRFRFLPLGLAGTDGSRRFYPPRRAAHVSHSITNLQETTGGFVAECLTVRTLCEREGVASPAILKMDIEGAENEVLADLVKHGPYPKAICVEFEDVRMSPESGCVRAIEHVEALRACGYDLLHVEDANALFVRRDL